MTIDIYIADSSPPCHAVLMTADYLGIKLNKINIDVKSGEHLKPEFLKINPQHSVPTIDDEGFYLTESRAIQAYLANKYAPDHPVYPKDPKERAMVDRMLYFDIGTLFNAQKGHLFAIFRNLPPDPEKNEVFKKALALLEGFLSSTPYVAGDDVTLADFSILASLTFAETTGYCFADFPYISNWIEKMKLEVPSYSAIEKSLAIVKEFLKSQKK